MDITHRFCWPFPVSAITVWYILLIHIKPHLFPTLKVGPFNKALCTIPFIVEGPQLRGLTIVSGNIIVVEKEGLAVTVLSIHRAVTVPSPLQRFLISLGLQASGLATVVLSFAWGTVLMSFIQTKWYFILWYIL